ncbi:proline-rich protein 5-like [Acanthaster planci]|uniref:Proline-rich protein 5-like n=1 Tax=Acanthaster planci TaxID=133434 RepID=A0A8B8A4A5_ACAPL|nr:proline-rich protein 5-like [Acanthaster planci]XP_022112217.1 proline-rich protein 5-like [Acanthaster planci]XP_022112218.1 proline-rich protein 5-like [Acanthaster planci]XP_022112219.1 proline-rich protein 5-like [Acanthaster planci]XP_022112221.1 proline-rich protein 5-like [Acanthaster planci]XP_022112222.1 proline-rich protein 5-like [Acanthaster planci]
MISRSRQSLANIAPPSALMSSLGHRQGSQGDISRALFGKVKGVNASARRGSAMAVMQRSDETAIKSQQVLGLRNDDWNSVQKKVLSIFRGGKLAPGELDDLNEQVRAALKSEIGEFITDYYKKNLLRRGMDLMYSSIITEDGPQLLASLAKQWNKFFCEVLPTLRAIFCPVQTKGLTILQLSLLGFRDHIVLKLHTLKDALSADRAAVPNEIVQMLLHLQSVRESGYPSEEHLHIESLVAKVVCPYLGTKGLYLGGDEPVVAAKIQQPMVHDSMRRRQENGRAHRTRPTSLQFTEPPSSRSTSDILSSPLRDTPTMSPREHSASLGALRRSPNTRRRGSHQLSSLETLLEDEKKRSHEMTDHEC